MCNIVTFRFTCQHTLRRRRSRCGGTKHKVTANSIKAACIAESFLTIYLRIECDPCQHKAWEEAWKLRLERANAFLTKLRQRELPGAGEVAALVQALEAEYATASWDTRKMFAHGPKPSITRVKHNYYERAASKLLQEVRPEDIVEKTEKGWDEMGEEDYDGNYVASTDPIHPVTTDYSHPLDDDNGDWILQHLSPEDIEPGFSDVIDLHNHSWSWGDDDNTAAIGTDTEVWALDRNNAPGDTKATQMSTSTDGDLVAWGPDVNKTSSGQISICVGEDGEAERSARVEEVINAFWSVVNAGHPTAEHHSPESTSTDSNTLNELLHDLNLSDSTDNRSDPSEQPPPTTSTKPLCQPLWTDGPSDSPPTTPPPPTRPSTPPSPNSTRSWYDKQRKILRQRREADIKKYYVDWLYISRCEIRDFEGPEGRMIREPLKLRLS